MAATFGTPVTGRVRRMRVRIGSHGAMKAAATMEDIGMAPTAASNMIIIGIRSTTATTTTGTITTTTTTGTTITTTTEKLVVFGMPAI